MSTFEYNDLYLKCQDTGIYHMFVFDMIGSKKMPTTYRQEAQLKMLDLAQKMYEEIEKIQIKTEKKILVLEEDFVTLKSGLPYRGFGMKQEPFILGDTFGFTVYRDSIKAETIYYLYEKIKQELNIDFDFHVANGFYETNDYALGGTKYFRGYCIDILSTLHKERTQKALNELRRK